MIANFRGGLVGPGNKNKPVAFYFYFLKNDERNE
jgi:hypothetical protein